MGKNKKVDFHTLNYICRLAKTLRPKEELTICQWAERNMVLPEGSNAAGKLKVENMPHQQAIMEAITDPEVVNVTVKSSAQVGKTTILLCVIGYYIDHEPATQLLVLPTLTLGETFSKTKVAKMIKDVKVLRGKVAPPKTKDSSNTISFKEYAGGHLIVAGANSPASLSSMPIRIVLMDEVDRYPESAGTEGDPVELAETRATSYWNKKYIKMSTPTIAGKSKIDESYNKGTMEEWCVQCPCCGTWQPYDWHRVTFEPIGMTCASCGETIEEQYWKESEHKWIPAYPDRISHRSFHLNALANPNVSWKELIEKWKEANERLKKYHDTQGLKTFINTKLGEVWEETSVGGESADDETLMKRAEKYAAEIPDGVLMLTAAVDVQDDRFEVEVKGWARDYENWGIIKKEIYGNLEKKDTWDELENFLDTSFSYASGTKLNIAATAIDTGGHHTNDVYKWVKEMNQKGKTVYAVKGYANKPGIKLIHKRSKGEIKETMPNGREVVVDRTTLYILGVDAGKESITKWLLIEDVGEKYCHFPSNEGLGYDQDYYKGLTSEKKVETTDRNGNIKTKWVKKRGVRNEPLDLFNYNLAACMIRRPSWDVLEEKIEKGINYMKAQPRVVKRKTRRSQKGIE